ncbi:MAG: outer membrane protein assembly factor BamB [Gammaproteobacteria bacterium]|nr:outer membrane protein assembly factor BamB [Gammaproteobacteria bacterium]MCI0591106.1 outer membrane protein assembly factor BamB [Gammaproteobacteria bacterium]
MMPRLLLMLCLFPISGCGFNTYVTNYFGGEDNADPPTPLEEFDATLQVVTLWTKQAGKGEGERYLRLTPAATPERIYTADPRGEVSAFDTSNGQLLWQVDTDEQISGGPGISEGLVLVGTSEGQVLAVAEEEKKVQWETHVSSEVLAPPLIADNVALIRTVDGKIFALNARSGEQLWVYERTVPALTLRGTGGPVVAGDMVICGFASGRLVALELSAGKPIWETPVAIPSGRSELERMVDIDTTPYVVDGTVYVATIHGRIAAIDQASGRMIWNRDMSSYAGVDVDERNVYVTDDQSHIWALDRSTGTSRWKQEKLHARAATAPASIGDFIVVGDLEGYLHWMHKDDGRFVARVRAADDGIIAPPIVINNVLYAYTTGGMLGAYTYQ